MKRKVWLAMLFVILVTGCSVGKGIVHESLREVGIDPTISWAIVTQDCKAVALSAPATYNVYIVSGVGPVPTITTPTTDIPCGAIKLVDQSKVMPKNTTPITGLSYQAILGEGQYTTAVEAVTNTGTRGIVSAPITFNVVNRPLGTTSILVGP